MHGITSLTAWQANPADILAGNRGHWQVENREHYVRDRTFDEDRSQGCVNIARGLEYLSRRLGCVLTLLGVLTKRPRKEAIRTRGLCR